MTAAASPAIAEPPSAGPPAPALPSPAVPPTVVTSADIGPPPKQPAPAATRAARRADPAEAARLLALGKTLIAIGQIEDARAILQTSADFGSADAARTLAGLTRKRPSIAAKR